jgi:hypothetical protein
MSAIAVFAGVYWTGAVTAGVWGARKFYNDASNNKLGIAQRIAGSLAIGLATGVQWPFLAWCIVNS